MTSCNTSADNLINGTDTKSEYLVHFKLVILDADAPARSKYTHTKGHSGYYGCPFCSPKGLRIFKSHAIFSTQLNIV